MSLEIVQHPHLRDSRRDWMLEPEEVSRIMELHRLGLGSRQIAGELGLARNTIKRYLKAGGRVHGGGVNSGVVQAGGDTSSLDGIVEVAIGSIGCKVKLRSRTCNQRRPRWPRTAWH